MILRKRLMVCTAVVALTGGTVMPALAAPWTRGFVVGSYEYAFRYGGRPDYSRGSEIEPGVDCPHGSTIHVANPDQTRSAIARQKWRSPSRRSTGSPRPRGWTRPKPPVSPAAISGLGPCPIAATSAASKPM